VVLAGSAVEEIEGDVEAGVAGADDQNALVAERLDVAVLG